MHSNKSGPPHSRFRVLFAAQVHVLPPSPLLLLLLLLLMAWLAERSKTCRKAPLVRHTMSGLRSMVTVSTEASSEQ